MKNKKQIIILAIIMCISLLLGCAKTSKYYGIYVCSTDSSRSVELIEFSIPHRRGKANFKNTAVPKFGIKNFSAKNVTFEVNKKTGRVLAFVCEIDGQTVSGTLDLDKITVSIDGYTYVKI